MLTMSPLIVFIMLLVPSLCEDPPTTTSEPDLGSPEEFLKEVNEYRAKFAKERKIPNMYKVTLLTETRLEPSRGRLSDTNRYFSIHSYHNMTEKISNEGINGEFKEELDANKIKYVRSLRFRYLELLNPLHAFIECSLTGSQILEEQIECRMRSSGHLNFWYANPGEAGSRCPPRFKGEDGLCVPMDPSKHTFWGTKEEFMEDVNYMRRKYAKEFGIPNMHQLTWNESLTAILDPLTVTLGIVKLCDACSGHWGYLGPKENSSFWVGFQSNWRITELRSFSAAVPFIDEDVHRQIVRGKLRNQGNSESGLELIHPLQTSIGCMEKRIKVDENDKKSKATELLACLVGNMGQWPTDWKIDVNSTKIPGSECMDGYVNDDGLCVLAPPITAPEPVPNTPKNPVTSEEKKKKEGDAEKEEKLESSVITRIYSYGLLILMFIRLLF
ncbi:unnamed protein product [Caenorhabditis brenneri]